MDAKPDVFSANCKSQQVLERIADRWTALVIYALSRGTRRYSELKREIGGVSQKMLTQTLRSLERDGLVARKVYPVVPPRVEYSLTPLGETLIEPLRAICKWAESHLHELQAARARQADERGRPGSTSLRASPTTPFSAAPRRL
jgi:DNA-binding HxlR family transcriptional regulator